MYNSFGDKRFQRISRAWELAEICRSSLQAGKQCKFSHGRFFSCVIDTSWIFCRQSVVIIGRNLSYSVYHFLIGQYSHVNAIGANAEKRFPVRGLIIDSLPCLYLVSELRRGTIWYPHELINTESEALQTKKTDSEHVFMAMNTTKIKMYESLNGTCSSSAI